MDIYATEGYTRKSQVNGFLAPSKGLIKVYPPESGTLIEKYVSEGQDVHKGDALFVLSTERSSRETAEARAAAITQLKQRRDSLVEELQKQHAIDEIEAHSLRDRIRGMEAELAQLQSELATQQVKQASAESTAQRYRALGTKKFVADVQVQEKNDALLEQRGKLQSMQRQRLEIERELNGLRLQVPSSELKSRNQRAAIERDIWTLEQELTEHESRRTTVITAPGDGKATAILAERGQMANTSSPLLSILPKGAVLEAHLLVPSRAIGFIAPNQTVAVRYQAFPYQRFGSHKGRITEMSKTLITPNDASNLPVTLQEPVYQVTAVLETQAIKAYGTYVPLQSGMLFEADVWLDHRRLVEWLLEPLFSISGRL